MPLKRIKPGEDHRGGIVQTPLGTSYWSGEDWELEAGPAIVRMSSGKARHISNCRLPDGTRGDVQLSIDHEHVFRRSATTGEMEMVDLNLWKRPVFNPDRSTTRYLFGTVEITASDAFFTDHPETTRQKHEFTSMALEMSLNPEIMHAVQDLTIATALYGALCNIDWIKPETQERYSCSWRAAGGVLADLRGHNESYTDFYCSGNEGSVDPEIARLLATIGWFPEDEIAGGNP